MAINIVFFQLFAIIICFEINIKIGFIMNEDSKVLLYDGNCNLCISSAAFVARRDKKRAISLITLQSGEACLAEYSKCDGLSCMNTVVFICGGRVFTKSTAILMVLRELGGLWKVVSWLKFIPRPLRDYIYEWVANRRTKLFISSGGK